MTQIQDAIGGLTSFSYDTNGNVLTVTDAKNQTTTYTYDEMDRLKTRTDALNRTERYQYDLSGNLTTFLDRKSQSSTFAYDALNRRTGATYPGATTTFGYDAISRLTSVSDSIGGNITWVYDTVSGGHHPRVQETTTPGTVIVEYDEIGRRLTLSATGQTDTTYTYDKNSRLKTVTRGTQTVTLTYDDAGRRTFLSYPNGVVTSYGYDNANRLLTIGHVKMPTTIEALTYTYDKGGNRITQVRQNAAASNLPTPVTATNIAYDAANELTRWNSATTNLTYDNNGNLATETQAGVITTYTWDSRNRLTGLSRTGLTASFVYDGLGRRKSKTINGTTTGFWYDGSDVYAELTGTTPSATYIRGLSLDEPYIRKGVSDEFYETDALGSAVALTNAAGTSQTTYTYEPFGNTIQTGTASPNAFQYTGRENDGTGLYYYRARYYHPKIQRFNKEDSFSGSYLLPSTLNRYAYVLNDPISGTDPFGLLSPQAVATLGGALFGVVGAATGAIAQGITPGSDPLAFTVIVGAGALGGAAQGFILSLGPLAPPSAILGSHIAGLNNIAAQWITGRKPINIGSAVGAFVGGGVGAAYRAAAQTAIRLGLGDTVSAPIANALGSGLGSAGTIGFSFILSSIGGQIGMP